jgi:hypothetical protein
MNPPLRISGFPGIEHPVAASRHRRIIDPQTLPQRQGNSH